MNLQEALNKIAAQERLLHAVLVELSSWRSGARPTPELMVSTGFSRAVVEEVGIRCQQHAPRLSLVKGGVQ